MNWWTTTRVRRALDEWPELFADATSKAMATPDATWRQVHLPPGSWQDLAWQHADLEAAVAALPDDQAEAARAVLRDGRPVRAVARDLGISPQAVRRRLRLAKRGIEGALVSRN